ncbi:hypothetical protein HYC85_016170 [Camellia sinensis]|uniref:Uncharacterized protein n=1 Tax=Camellia sinensis TaxID=4442 RepID=A0A7J7GYU5_CAMSI|nr:hypothetical protein HYC85_016170 [Camellia sinensis]
MMLGFTTLLLAISERQIAKICVPKSVGETFLPCRSITSGGGPEPMDICTSSTTLPYEIPSCDCDSSGRPYLGGFCMCMESSGFTSCLRDKNTYMACMNALSMGGKDLGNDTMEVVSPLTCS